MCSRPSPSNQFASEREIDHKPGNQGNRTIRSGLLPTFSPEGRRSIDLPLDRHALEDAEMVIERDDIGQAEASAGEQRAVFILRTFSPTDVDKHSQISVQHRQPLAQIARKGAL